MRVSPLVFAAIFACATPPALAQTVIDVDRQAPPQVQEQGQPRDQAPPEAPTQAQESSQPPVSSRYSFNRVDNGFLRLDNDSGQIAYCSARTTGWTCQAVPENRAALETEIARLQDEIASLKKLGAEIVRLRDEVVSLKKDVAALKEPLPPRPPTDLTPPSADKGGDLTIKLPTQEDMARASAFIKDTWHRLIDMIVTMQKDMMRKG